MALPQVVCRDIQWRETRCTRRRDKEDAMKYSTGHRVGESVHRSTSVVLSPYFIDDVAMTPREFEQSRRSDVMVIAPR
jgi:hypothetical protein